MAYLNALTGTALGKRYELDRIETIMGRHPECHVVLDSGAVSRQHAKIVRDGDRYMLEDLKSRNGTFVNGRLIGEPTAMQDGDVLRICELELSFHSDLEPSNFSEADRDGSSMGVLIYDDENESPSHSVTAKIEVRSGVYGSTVGATSEVKLAAMVEIMQALGKALSMDEVLPKVLDSLFRIFIQADRGFIILNDAEGNLHPRWVKTRRPDQEEMVRVSRTVLKQVMEKKEAIISLDAGSDERFQMSQSVSDFRIRSMIVAPLLNTEGEALGAIQIDTIQHKGRFEPRDLEVLAAVANQAGIAIENAQLHEQMIQQRLVEQDLELARQVQQAFLPKVTPDTKAYSFFQYYNPANEIGGDYFDYIPLENDRIAVVVADVVGHGVAAAMFMAKLSAETRYAFASENNPAVALGLLNQRLTALGVERFVTMLVIILETTTRNATIVNAGHMAPILRAKNGSISEPGADVSGPPLGIIDDLVYESFDLELDQGDTLMLYTDGIFEAPNAKGDQFSIARLRTLLGQTTNSVEKTGKSIVDAVEKHIKGCLQEDDMCLVVFNRQG
ncbi:MAG: SpoIIE family protein phosphatase [Pirellulaceae bacterium]|nr:SpoIIE family protein phosphatase [Pirellulaceae bacterium]